MAINSRTKGKRGELELSRLFRSWGYDTRRGQQFKGGADSPDVVGLPYIHVECKRVERLDLEGALLQAHRDAGAGLLPAVFHRRNGGRWRVTVDIDTFKELYTAYELCRAEQEAEK